ncbi:HAD-IA family hydrolase [Alteromonas pelagimontana]|uniref:HAD-IA family hydrolase n=1 Tax=Alteromonas pelagimontana TaxID=1858656 RepID=A0A6M4MED7_9ALTE|nr:HAD-IA family hydrolase [Alteromonas pelagimontana]QJR81218.1 HAD-IA family hydrolase [Alteromonas pelagimontana]
MRFYRPISAIKAMTFDLDDTLYDNSPVIEAAEKALLAHITSRYPKTSALPKHEWQKIQRGLISQTPELASDMGQLRLRTLRAALQHDITAEDVLDIAAQECFDCFYGARSNLQLEEHVHEVLAVLSQRIPLIGITNGNVDAQRIGIQPYFSTIYHASLERPMKPHPHMFDEAVAHINVPHAQILHVGDNLIKDVYGAISAGFQAAWFACDRPMILNQEPVHVLPHVALDSFDELLLLVD